MSEEAKEEVKEEVKEEMKEEVKEEAKEENKEEAKEEIREERKEEVNSKPGKKNFFKNLISSLASGFAEVFKDYPVTMIMILMAALFAAILVHVEYKDKWRENYEIIMQFGFCMAAQSFVIEELFKKKTVPKISGFVFALLFSAAFVFVEHYKKDALFGIDFDLIEDIWNRVWVVYGILITGIVIYHIFRRLRAAETPFCYDIADKIKGAGHAAWGIGFGLLVFGAAAALSLSDRQLLRPYGFGYVEFGILILGALLTISAYVFNYGCKLQQESDETL